MPTIEVNGTTFNYSIAGEDNEETIFTLHGGRGAGDHQSDFGAYKVLADRYRVISFDQRGHGKTSLTPPFTFNQLADDVEALRKAFCGDRKCIVIGGSFGGMIALTYVLRHLDSCSHLVLRGTAPSHDMEDDAIEIVKQRRHLATSLSLEMIDKLFSDTIESELEFRLIWLAIQPLYSENFDPNLAFERTRDLDAHVETHNALYTPEAKAGYDVRPRLGEIKMPTLIVVGTNDWICPPSQSRLIADGIVGSELHEIPDANHAVHIQAKDVVMPLIRDFLQR
jgi:proline iminopeptidase